MENTFNNVMGVGNTFNTFTLPCEHPIYTLSVTILSVYNLVGVLDYQFTKLVNRVITNIARVCGGI